MVSCLLSANLLYSWSLIVDSRNMYDDYVVPHGIGIGVLELMGSLIVLYHRLLNEVCPCLLIISY